MKQLLTSGKLGKITQNHFRQIKEETVKRWDKIGFLNGLKGHLKDTIAQLYENEANYLLNESTMADGSSGSFETVVFPIVRRVFSRLLANDIVSVQALNMPIGKLFYFVPKTSDRAQDPNNSNVFTHTSDMSDQVPTECCSGSNLTELRKKNLYDLFYNDGLFDASKGNVTIQVLDNSSTPHYESVYLDNSGEFQSGMVPRANDDTQRYVIIKLSGFNATNAGRLTGPDGNEMDSESFLSSLKIVNTSGEDIVDPNNNTIIPNDGEIPFRVVTQKYGKGIVNYGDICDAQGVIYLELDLTHPIDINSSTQTYDGYIGADVSTSGSNDNFFTYDSNDNPTGLTNDALVISYAQYDTLEMATEMGEVSFELQEVVVSVTERKLRATWSPELAQDVSAFHNINAEAELTALLSEQIAAEIDREILRDLRHDAPWVMRWDYNGWRLSSNSSTAYTQKDWNQTLITKINQISAQIHKATLRGGANFIVVSSEISAVFDNLEYFHVSDANPEQDQYNMGIERIGSLNGRYQVYRDPYSPHWSLLIGHKGKSLLDTGYIYAPYVPLQLTPTLYNPFNFAPVKGIMTRYAKKTVNNRFYGQVRVDGIPTFNINELR